MSLDQTALFTAIVTKIDTYTAITSPNLFLVHGNVWSDGVPAMNESGQTYPFVNLTLESGAKEFTVMGSSSRVDIQPVKFTVTSTTRSQAADIAKAIVDAFHKMPTTLTGFIACLFESRSAKDVGKLPSAVVYESTVTLNFWIQS